MGQLTYGLGSQNLNFNLPDFLLRNIQTAMTGALIAGKTFFFRSVGSSGEGPSNITIILNPASQLAFRYEGNELREPDQEFVGQLERMISEDGGIWLDEILNRLNSKVADDSADE